MDTPENEWRNSTIARAWRAAQAAAFEEAAKIARETGPPDHWASHDKESWAIAAEAVAMEIDRARAEKGQP